MPRTVRVSVGSLCYHVINRGNARACVFHDPRDFYSFVSLMRQACVRIPMRIPESGTYVLRNVPDYRRGILRSTTPLGVRRVFASTRSSWFIRQLSIFWAYSSIMGW